jgi:hypothetical protein
VSNATDFISELVKSANQLEQANDFERKRLIDNAVIIIRHMREVIADPTGEASWDSVMELQSVSAAVTIGWASDTQVRVALLDAARMIRHLHIAVSAAGS